MNKKVLILGSMCFLHDIDEIAKELSFKGYDVRTPRNAVPENNKLYDEGISVKDLRKEREEYDLYKIYHRLIQETDVLLIFNREKKGIEGYIGGNVLIEMGTAYVLDKKIFLMNEIPDMDYRDEIEAMNPIIINGDLEKIC